MYPRGVLELLAIPAVLGALVVLAPLFPPSNPHSRLVRWLRTMGVSSGGLLALSGCAVLSLAIALPPVIETVFVLCVYFFGPD
jgi:hypothetical protein